MKTGDRFTVDALKDWLKQHGIKTDNFIAVLKIEEQKNP